MAPTAPLFLMWIKVSKGAKIRSRYNQVLKSYYVNVNMLSRWRGNYVVAFHCLLSIALYVGVRGVVLSILCSITKYKFIMSVRIDTLPI